MYVFVWLPSSDVLRSVETEVWWMESDVYVKMETAYPQIYLLYDATALYFK